MRIRVPVSLVLTLLVTIACSAQPYKRKIAPVVIDGDTQLLWARYTLTIYDASVYRFDHVRKLRPLVPDAQGKVRVATLTSNKGTDGKLTSTGDGIWVTGVPEVKDICQQWKNVDIMMRLRMLIGLPPDADIPYMVEVEANVSDIFRPSPYADTNTTYPCPPNPDGSLPSNCGNVFPTNTSPAHYQWIATDSFILHTIPDGYPWTHLGYTYNWAPGEDRYGASEYVIRSGVTVPIIGVFDPVQYCTPVTTTK